MTILLTVLVVAFLVGNGVRCLLMAGGGPRRGMASGFTLHQAMSAAAMRRRARITRPGTEVTRRTPVRDVALEIGHVGRRWLYAALEEVVLVFALPRAGKTALLANHVIDAPGAVVATSTKADIYTLTAATRQARGRPVVVFNPEGLGGIPSTVRWSPVSGCEVADTAIMRAAYLIGGAQESKGSSEREFWNGNAHRALRCHLMAAALAGRNAHDVQFWGQNLTDEVPIRILRNHPQAANGWAHELERIGSLPSKTRESIGITLASSLAFMSAPALARAATPGDGERVFDVDRFLAEQGTLYLLGSQRPYGSVGPLFAALSGHLFETAKARATHKRGGRLNPPLTGVLDEAALICRLPLERLTADCGGRGIPLVISVQGPDQLYDAWGESGGRTIWNNAGVKLAFGGLSVGKHLHELSDLCGKRVERRRSISTGGSGMSTSDSLERIPVMTVEDIREIPDLHVLALYRNLPPVVAAIRPVWTRADVKAAGEPAMPAAHTPTGPLAAVIWLQDWARNRKAS